MNRVRRRGLRVDAAIAVSKAKSFVVVCFDGKGVPVYYGDMGSVCGEKRDARHVFMHRVFEMVGSGCDALMDIGVRAEIDEVEREKVREVKAARSEELSCEG